MTTKSRLLLLILTAALVLGLAALPAQPARAEGSDDLMDFEAAQGGTIRYPIKVKPGVARNIFHVYLQDGETLHLGSNTIGRGDGDIYLWSPGTEVYTDTYPSAAVFATAIVTCTDQGADVGLINTRAKENAGPLPNTDGYTSCTYTASASGLYPLMFTARYPDGGNPNSASLTGTIGAPSDSGVLAWDATVRDANGDAQPGRLFTDAFNFYETAGGPDQEFYVLTRDGHQYRLQLDEVNGAGWQFFVNNKGVQDRASGDPTYMSWRSADVDDAGDPQFYHEPYLPDTADDVTHRLFLNRPDPAVITGTGGLSATLGYAGVPLIDPAPTNLTFDGSNAGGGDGYAVDAAPWATPCEFTFDSAPAQDGQAFALVIDANRNGSFSDEVDRRLTGILDSAGNSVAFDGRDGNGDPLTDDLTYAVRLASQGGELHYPMQDVENFGGFHIERLTNLGTGDVHHAYYDDYNVVALTEADPPSLPQGGDSSPHTSGFRGYLGGSGDKDIVDTWTYVGSAPANLNFVLGASANQTIVKTANPATVMPGETITYVLTFSNTGTALGTGIVITDVVPISATVTRVISSSDVLITETTTAAPTYTWAVADLAPGEGGVITLTAQVLALPPETLQFDNVAQIDSHSNRDSDAATVTVIDTIPPATPANPQPADGTLTNDNDVTLSWDAVTDAVSYTINVSGTLHVVNAPATTLDLTDLADGTYPWTVTAYDAAGNASAPTAEIEFTVDATPPATPVLSGPDDGTITTTTTLTLAWGAVGDAVSYTVHVSGTVYVVDAPMTTLSLPFPAGAYTWTVTAHDVAGNVSAVTTDWVFAVTGGVESVTRESFVAGTPTTFGSICGQVVFTATGTLPTSLTITYTYDYPSVDSNGMLGQYRIVAEGGENYAAALTLCYDDADLPAVGIAAAQEPNLHAYRYIQWNQPWQQYSEVDTVNNTVTAYEVTEFGVWGLGIDADGSRPTAVALRTLVARGGLWAVGLVAAVGGVVVVVRRRNKK